MNNPRAATLRLPSLGEGSLAVSLSLVNRLVNVLPKIFFPVSFGKPGPASTPPESCPARSTEPFDYQRNSLFFCIENDRQIEAMPFSFHGNQHLITRISGVDGRQEIVRSPDRFTSHCDDQIRA